MPCFYNTAIAFNVLPVIINGMKKSKKSVKYIKIKDDTVKIPDKKGNGVLKLVISADSKGKIKRYSFSYINYHLCAADNGRVLGYDNCHGYHHRHYMGKEELFKFISYENIQERFEKEWRALHEKVTKDKKH